MDEVESELIQRVGAGDESALADLFARYRGRLVRLVEVRMSGAIRKRVGVDDVLQESWIEACRRIEHAKRTGDTPIFVWMRLIVCQTIADLERRHLGAEARSVHREVSGRLSVPASSSVSIAHHLLAQQTTPIQAAARSETRADLERKLDEMEELDREVLLLRHFEELSNREAAVVLGLSDKAASTRYFRALGRLRKILPASND